MNGKSTYIRAIALAAIMVQVGPFVSAKYVSPPVTNRLFTRVSTADDTKANDLAFASELRERHPSSTTSTGSRIGTMDDDTHWYWRRRE
jgi:DNA mismatch repair ATPase MutS